MPLPERSKRRPHFARQSLMGTTFSVLATCSVRGKAPFAADLHGTADEGRFLRQHRRKGVPADDDRVGKVQYGQVVLDLPGGELGVRQQANDHRADALRVHLRAVANAEEMGRLLVAGMVVGSSFF
ncbi:hypothetical protein TYRP_012117 [Tyrophagus putrescentiae]|nr:hypothetical protein TYRP_012117 [Tyrophagus putrescentiae]